MPQTRPRHLDIPDPIGEHRDFNETESRVALAGHPLHAMMVSYPIALCICTLGADLLFWLTGHAFWPAAGFWAALVAFGMGALAGLVGAAELLWVPGIRIRSASWSHFIIAVMLIALLGANFAIRLGDPAAMILPWGIATSALASFMTGITGWHGGKLVFDYGVGVQQAQAQDHGKDS